MSRTLLDPSMLAVPAIQNILDNGGMEIWQRGTSFSSPANTTYTADRWTASVNGTPTFTVTQDSGTVDTGSFSAKVNITVASGTVLALRQQLENYLAYVNQTIVLTARVKTTMAGVSLVVIGTAPVLSTTHPGDGNWHTLVAVGTVPASPTQLGASIGFVGNTVVTGAMWIDSVMMSIGTQPVPFIPLPPSIDLARCQRFYFRIAGRTANNYIVTGQCFSTTAMFGVYKYPVEMRATPNFNIVNATSFQVSQANSAFISATSMSFAASDPVSSEFQVNVASGLVAGNATNVTSSSTSAYIEVSADL